MRGSSATLKRRLAGGDGGVDGGGDGGGGDGGGSGDGGGGDGVGGCTDMTSERLLCPPCLG